jgi:hypothetical protein
MVDEHPRAGLKGGREVSEGDLAALPGDEQFGRLRLEKMSTLFIARTARCCNFVTGTVG